MGYIILAIIIFIIFFATIRFLSRWLYNKGKLGYFLHNLFSLIGSIIMLALSFAITGSEDGDSLIAYTIIYAIITFLTFFWFASASKDDFVTYEWTEEKGTFDPVTGHYSGTSTDRKSTENLYSLKNVLILSIFLAAIFAVVTYFLIETGFAWIPSSIAVAYTAYLVITSFKD